MVVTYGAEIIRQGLAENEVVKSVFHYEVSRNCVYGPSRYICHILCVLYSDVVLWKGKIWLRVGQSCSLGALNLITARKKKSG